MTLALWKQFTFLVILSFAYSRNIGTILHVSDLHFDSKYVVGSHAECLAHRYYGLPCCHSYEISEGPRKAGLFGDPNCDSPIGLLEKTFEFIQSLPKPDYTLYTGDAPGHNDLTQTPESNLKAITTVNNLFTSYLPDHKVFPCYGNHDTWPIDQLAVPNEYSWLISPVAKLWKTWLPEEEQQKTISYGGYYSVIVKPGLRLISLNTLYYDSWNKLVGQVPDPAHQFEWLNNTLHNSTVHGEKVWIIGHIFPGNGEASELFSNKYQEISSTYKDIILAHFFAHSHRDQFTLLRDSKHQPSGIVLVNPSVTGYGGVNPSVRMYTYDRDTFEILDIIQYNTKLAESNAKGYVNFTITYKALELLNMTDLSAQSWADLVKRMATDDHVYQTYYNNVFMGGTIMWPCEYSCKTSLLCGLAYSSHADITNCAQNGGPFQNLTPVTHEEMLTLPTSPLSAIIRRSKLEKLKEL